MEQLRPEMQRNEAAVDSELVLLPMIENLLPLFGHAHPCVGAPIFAYAQARHQRHLLEISVALIVIKKTGHCVVGNINVDVAVSVCIRQGNTQAFARFRNSDFSRDFGESAIAIIVEYERRNCFERIRAAVSANIFTHEARSILKIPNHISQHD